jgi:hypothetical protein
MKHLTLTAVSLLLIGLTMSGTAYSQVPAWEREALIAIYNATDGDNWSNKTGWLGDAGTECDWLYTWFWNPYLDFVIAIPIIFTTAIKAVFSTWLGFWILGRMK